jgi:hypothetical protein
MKSTVITLPAGMRQEWHANRLRAGISLVLLVLLAACATTLPVRTDFDKQANFSGYRTYTWVSDNPMIIAAGDNPEISPLTRSRIITAIENELQRKGYTKAAMRDQADFAVAFTVGTRDRIDINAYPAAYRGYWYWRHTFWDYEIRSQTYQEGMLAIDIFDQRTHKPVWHGFTHKRITGSDRDNPAPVIQEAVAAILAKFPPKQQSSG